MNEGLTSRWINEVVGKFSFGKRLLAWDISECHRTDKVNKWLRAIKVEFVFLSGDGAKFIQIPDISWNKLCKALVSEQYDEWFGNGMHEYKPAGNLKPAPKT